MCLKKMKDFLHFKLGQNKSANLPIELLSIIDMPLMPKRVTNAIAKYPLNCKKEMLSYFEILAWLKPNRNKEFEDIIFENHQNYRKVLAKLKEELGFERDLMNALIPEINKSIRETYKRMGQEFWLTHELNKNVEIDLRNKYKKLAGNAIEKLKYYKEKYSKEQILTTIKSKIRYSKKCWLSKVFDGITGFCFPTYKHKRENQILDLKIVVELVDDLPRNVIDVVLKYSFEDKKELHYFLLGIDILKPNNAKEIILTNYENPQELIKELMLAIFVEIFKQPRQIK